MLESLAAEVDGFIFNHLSKHRQLFPIDATSRQYLLTSCRKRLNQRLKLKPLHLRQPIPNFLLNHNAITFVSLGFRGKTLSCVSYPEENILASALSATEIAAEYFLSNFPKKYCSKIYIEICILFNPKVVSVKQLYKNFIKGLHGVSLETKHKKVFFKNAVPIQYAFDTSQVLEKLYEKTGGQGKFNAKHKNIITLYDSIEFREDILDSKNPYGLFDFFRHNVIFLQKEITLSFIKRSIRQLQSCLEGFIKSNGQMFYEINGVTGEKIKTNSRAATIRKLAGLWALESHKKNKISKAKKILYSYVDREDLGMFSFMIFVEGKFKYSEKFKKLSEGFFKKFIQRKWERVALEDWLTKVVALNALLVCAEKTKNLKFLALAEKNFSSCKDFLGTKKEAYQLCGWLSKFAAKLYRLTNKVRYANFVIKLNKMLLHNQIDKDFFLIDAIGAFDFENQSRVTSIYLESLTEGFQMATTQKDFKSRELFYSAIAKAVRALLGNQFRVETSFNPSVLGAFKNSSVDFNIRIDNLQHALLALRASLNVLTKR